MAIEPIVIEWQVGKGLKSVHDAFKSVEKAQRDLERNIAIGTSRENLIKQRGADKTVQTVERARQSESRAAERAAGTAARAVERGAADEIRARERAAKQALDIQLRSATMAGRIAARSVAEDSAMRRRFTGAVSGSVRGTLGTIARVGGTVTALGGGFSMADAVQTGLTNRGKAADLSLQSGSAVSTDEIMRKATSVGNALGVASEQVIAGLDAFVAKSGDVKAGFASINDLVELATATGGDIGEISRTAGIVQMTTGNTKETMSVMREMAGMGRAGSVDMRELAQYAGRITAGAGQFGNKRTAITQLGAFVQQAAATGGATAAPEATEAVARLATDVFEHESAFKAAGVKTRDAGGKLLRDPMSIVKESIAATGGDTGKLLNMFGKMSYKAVAGYQNEYIRRVQEVRGGGGTAAEAKAAGLEKIDELFAKFADAALKEDQVKAEAAKRIQEVDKQLVMVFNELRDSLAAEMIPVLKQLLPQLRELVPAFVKLLGSAVEVARWFAENPFKGILTVIAAKMGPSIAAAGIGPALRQSMIAQVASSAAGIGLAAAITTAIGQAFIDYKAQEDVKKQKDIFGAGAGNAGEEAAIMRMPEGPEKLEALRKLRGKMSGDLSKAEGAQKDAGSTGATLSKIARFAPLLFGPSGIIPAITGSGGVSKDIDEATKTKVQAYGTAVDSLTTDVERTSKAIQALEGVLTGPLTGGYSPNPSAPRQNVSMSSNLRSGAP